MLEFQEKAVPENVEEFPQDQEYTCLFAIDSLITVDPTHPRKYIGNWRNRPQLACVDRTVDSYILDQRVVDYLEIDTPCPGVVCFILTK
ncbi:MAG: hypothetical protein EOR69_18750 [Mesorhizobium sp.]|nr:MAG: hypothetical protein EOR69_18750 [Mesorhizobium sp.]RWL97085.1 MAG: hypothetical protein EOR70_18070 [Mesorhizobium sp.]